MVLENLLNVAKREEFFYLREIFVTTDKNVFQNSTYSIISI